MAKKSLGIEIGSTRIKAVLLEDFEMIVTSNFEWENQFIDGYWTYDLEYMWEVIRNVFSDLRNKYRIKFNRDLDRIDFFGVSAMMHGYLVFDDEGKLLTSFRTWRNTNTDEASNKLTDLFKFNIPHRWSIAHLYQAILNGEKHIDKISYITTLSGYVHWKLTGQKILGIGDASGMFPINQDYLEFDKEMISKFNMLIDSKVDWKLEDILPKVRLAGENSGFLNEEGLRLLGLHSILKNRPICCPPEGDAGTGMISTNSIYKNTGNISAGTSIFLMLVLERKLKQYYREVDIVTTPDGKAVAMIHCNNFTSDINNWVNLLYETIDLFEIKIKKSDLFEMLFKKSIEADSQQGKLLSCNYYAGEPIVKIDEGRPLFIQMPDSKLNIANFMQSHIFSALATLKIGLDNFMDMEDLKVDYIVGHGGFFKTRKIGQEYMANAINIPISVMSSADEGGAWGIAILALFINFKHAYSLSEYMNKVVFKVKDSLIYYPEKNKVENYNKYIQKYIKMLEIEKEAIEKFKL